MFVTAFMCNKHKNAAYKAEYTSIDTMQNFLKFKIFNKRNNANILYIYKQISTRV